MEPLIANPPWDDDTQTGAYGSGSLATAEKGKIWLEAAIAEKVSHITKSINSIPFVRKDDLAVLGCGDKTQAGMIYAH